MSWIEFIAYLWVLVVHVVLVLVLVLVLLWVVLVLCGLSVRRVPRLQARLREG